MVKVKAQIKRSLIVLGSVLLLCVLSLGVVKLLFPFLIAFMLAYVMNPIVNFLTFKLKIGRGLAVVITILTLSGGLGVAIFFSIVEGIAGIKYLLNMIPQTVDTISKTITTFTNEKVIPVLDEVGKIYNGLSDSEKQNILQQLESIKNEWLNKVTVFAESILNSSLNIVQSLPGLATMMLFILLGTFFISKDWYSLKARMVSFVPVRMKARGKELKKGLHDAFIGFIKAQLTVLLITIIITIIGMFVLQIKYAFLVGLLIGSIDIIPYAGTGLVLIPWSIYSFMIGDTWIGIGLAATYITIVIVRQTIEPKILSSNMGLDTLATIISMYVGLVMFGIFGLVIGPALLVLITTCMRIRVFHDIWDYIQDGKIDWKKGK